MNNLNNLTKFLSPTKKLNKECQKLKIMKSQQNIKFINLIDFSTRKKRNLSSSKKSEISFEKFNRI